MSSFGACHSRVARPCELRTRWNVPVLVIEASARVDVPYRPTPLPYNACSPKSRRLLFFLYSAHRALAPNPPPSLEELKARIALGPVVPAHGAVVVTSTQGKT